MAGFALLLVLRGAGEGVHASALVEAGGGGLEEVELVKAVAVGAANAGSARVGEW